MPYTARLERHRPAGVRRCPAGFDARRPAARRPARRAAATTRRRCSSLAAQIEARAAVGGPPAAAVTRERRCSTSPLEAARARRPPCSWSASAARRPARRRDQEHADRPRQRGRPRGRARRSARCWPRAARRRDPRRGGRRRRGHSGLRWVVDPLDGTVNYLFGHPAVVASASPCEDATARSPASCYDPLRDELFAARPRRAARRSTARRCRPRRDDRPRRPRWSRPASATTPRCARARRRSSRALLPRCATSAALGSAALDLAWTAAGRYDAYYERGGAALGRRGRADAVRARAGLEVRELPARRRAACPASLAAPPAFADELFAIVR